MATIIFNGDLEFEFNEYSRNTYFNGESINSDGYVNNIKGANVGAELSTFGNEPITSLQIKKDDEIIYNLPNIDANLTSINEGYNGERMYTNIALHFNI